MGATPSMPEEVYRAVARNDQVELQALCTKLAQLRRTDPAFGARVLEWRDKDGRTPLLLSAAKNFYPTARLLLQHGADVTFVNNTGRGNALHEAAHNRHEAMVEMLLQHGAQPFMVNSHSKTPIDEAVTAGHVNIVRRLEREALFSGAVAIKRSTMVGFSTSFQTRWVVVMHRYPNPQDREPQLRKVMWVFKDRESAAPRLKVWLDGAVSSFPGPPGSTDGVVRLHSSHPEPTGSTFTRYDRGYCLFFRPVSQAAAAVDTCRAMMTYCNPTRMLMAPATSTPPNFPTVAGAQNWAGSPSPAPSMSGVAPFTAQSMPVLPSPGGVSGGDVYAPRSTPQLGRHARADSSLDTDVLAALPGETDQQFASRLASTITAATGAADSQDRHSGGGYPTPPRASLAPVALGTAMPGGSSGNPFQDQAWPSAGAPPTPRKDLEPSAPPMSGASGAAHAGDNNTCVICLSAERSSGFLHGTTVHACACPPCAAMFRVGSPCPMCRAPVERVLGVY